MTMRDCRSFFASSAALRACSGSAPTCAAIVPLPTGTVLNLMPPSLFAHGFLMIKNAAAPTTRIGLRGGFSVPKNYVGSAKVIIVWSATVTTGEVVWTQVAKRDYGDFLRRLKVHEQRLDALDVNYRADRTDGADEADGADK